MDGTNVCHLNIIVFLKKTHVNFRIFSGSGDDIEERPDGGHSMGGEYTLLGNSVQFRHTGFKTPRPGVADTAGASSLLTRLYVLHLLWLHYI